MARQKDKQPSKAFNSSAFGDDGIPEYNALLDKHLGSRRGFLLGRKKSLKHLERAGCISFRKNRTEARKGDQSAPWCIEISTESVSISQIEAKKKAKSRLALKDAKNKAGTTAELRKIRPKTAGVRKSYSANEQVHKDSGKIRELAQQEENGELNELISVANGSNGKLKHSRAKQKNRTQGGRAHQQSELDKLLKSDSTFQIKIEETKEEIEAAKRMKIKVERQVDSMRKRVRGINAVKENDIAVAHCSGVMQKRIVKAERECMKAVTQRLNLRNSVNDARRDLISVEKVKSKLGLENSEAEGRIIALEKRVKKHRNLFQKLSDQTSKVKSKAEEATVKRWHDLPNSDSSEPLDVPKIMKAMQERAASRKQHICGNRQQQLELKYLKAKKAVSSTVRVTEREKSNENVTNYKDAFTNLQRHLGYQTIPEFITSFVQTETDLLSMYKHNTEIKEARLKLEAELDTMSKDMDATGLVSCLDHESHFSTVESLKAQLKETLDHVAIMNEKKMNAIQDHGKLHPLLVHFIEVLKDNLPSLRGSSIASLYDYPLSDLLGIIEEHISEVAIANRLNAKSRIATTRKKSLIVSSDLPVGPRLPKTNSGGVLKVSPPTLDSLAITFENIDDEDLRSFQNSRIRPSISPQLTKLFS